MANEGKRSTLSDPTFSEEVHEKDRKEFIGLQIKEEDRRKAAEKTKNKPEAPMTSNGS